MYTFLNTRICKNFPVKSDENAVNISCVIVDIMVRYSTSGNMNKYKSFKKYIFLEY